MLDDITNQEAYHPKLRKLVPWLEATLGVHFVKTSGIRPGDTGVHGHGRGIDLRIRNREFGAFLVKFINQRWTYDPERPHIMVAVAHGSGANYHLHLQVHDNTRKY